MRQNTTLTKGVRSSPFSSFASPKSPIHKTVQACLKLLNKEVTEMMLERVR